MPNAQWQGYTDSNKDRGWGVQEWARRAGQGAYFDWVTANALLPSTHPNTKLEGIQKVDRKSNSDIAVISANLNGIQNTFDQANRGQNPLGLSGNALVFDIDPTFLEVGSTAQIGTRAVQGLMHFDQIYERALKMLENVSAIWDNANEIQNRLQTVANNEAEFRNSVFQEDLSYRNQLIELFGKPYEGTIGPGRVYPAGYNGPDTLLYMCVDVRTIDDNTVPGPSSSFAKFNSDGTLTGGDIYDAFNGQGSGGAPRGTLSNIQKIQPKLQLYLSESTRRLFAPTFTPDTGAPGVTARSGLYAVNYTDLVSPKVPLDNLTQLMPVTAAGYTFQAPREWGSRQAVGELQLQINKMLQQEAQIASAIGAWDALQGGIVRELRLLNAKVDSSANILLQDELFSRIKVIVNSLIKGFETGFDIAQMVKDTVLRITDATQTAIPTDLPTAGLSFSPGDALSAARSGIKFVEVGTFTGLTAAQGVLKGIKTGVEIAFDITENELNLFKLREADAIAAKEMMKNLENLVGDEPIKRIAIFKEIQALREMSDEFRAMVDKGTRLIDERAAYNKRVAAQTQSSRYQDMTFRVAQNNALQTYRQAFDVAARYTYLAAKAYDYETNFDPSDPASPKEIYGEIMRARSLGMFDGVPRMGKGGLSEALAKLKSNYDVLEGQLGMNTPQIEIGKASLRTENFRILPTGSTQPTGSSQFPSPGTDSDALWRQTLQQGRVDDLWMVPEFRYLCRRSDRRPMRVGRTLLNPESCFVLARRSGPGRTSSGNR